MVAPPQDDSQLPSVSVDMVDGKWVVKILENLDTWSRDFEIESFARSFADGQRYRLGVPPLG